MRSHTTRIQKPDLRTALLSLMMVLSTTAVPAGAADIERSMRVAVTDFDVQGISGEIASVVTDALLIEIRKLRRVSVIGMDEIRVMLELEANKQLMGCSADDSCLAEIADALGADILIAGSMARVGDSHVIGLRRIDQKEAQVTATAQRRLVPAEGDEFLAAIGPLVEELFPDVALRDGTTRGVSPELALRLSPPPLPSWLCYTTFGTASVLGVTSMLAGGISGLAVLEYNMLADTAKTTPIRYADLALRQNIINVVGGTAWTFAALAVVTATTGGIMTLFTDFHSNTDGE